MKPQIITNSNMTRTHLLFLLLPLIALLSCGDSDRMADEDKSQDKLAEEIMALEDLLKKQMDNPTLDTASAVTFIEKTEVYASKFEQDSLTPKFLFSAAAVARGIGEYEEAVQLWAQVEEGHLGYEKQPESIFFQAFTYDNDLQDMPKAIEKYEKFLIQYPKHPIAKDARMLLKVAQSGKSPNQVVKEFQEQQNQATE